MPLTIPGVPTQLVPLSLQLWDEYGQPVTGVYPRAQVMPQNGSTTPVAEVDLDEVDGGLYTKDWAITTASKFLIRYQVFTDALRNDLSDEYTFDQPDLVVADEAAATPPSIIASGVDPTLGC